VARRELAASSDRVGIDVASRTDRGVSARGNALRLDSALAAAPLLRALNGISPEIFFTALTRVPESFRVRRATRRVYRYFEPASSGDAGRRSRAARLFAGSIDVRSFGRGIPSGAPSLREVESLTVAKQGDFLVTEIRARSFVWGMVRKVVSALREHDAGRLSLERLESALRGRVRLALPLSEPEGLVLWDVEYPLEWEQRWSGPNRRQVAQARTTAERLQIRSEVLRSLSGHP
jgi:tRNA pseudouridine38-40 synthase